MVRLPPYRSAVCSCLFGAIISFMLLTGLGSKAEGSQPLRETGVIPRDSTLKRSLAAKGIPSRQIHLITSLLSPHVNLKRIRPDSAFRVSLDQDGELQEFLLEVDSYTICLACKDSCGRYTVSQKPWNRRFEASVISGRVSTNLEETLENAGESKELAVRFREILADSIGICPDMEEGDQFKLVVDKIFADDKLMRYGEIHSFVIRKGKAVVRAFRYEGTYYDEKGNSLRQPFLRVPLDYHFVSSEFMKSRKHPILGGTRPHYAVDFAAPIGTPVWAVADGEVVSCGWQGGLGFAVRLKHSHGYETLYGHLQRFGRRIQVGARVERKQIIGYIGASGLSTGPHLHFSLIRDGKYLDPLLECFPREKITETSDSFSFLKKKKIMLALMGES